MKKEILIKFLPIVTIFIITQGLVCSSTEILALEKTEKKVSNPIRTDDNAIWDCIWFGNYYQSNSTTKEPIKWRVLSVDGDDAFVLSDKVLDCISYNQFHVDVTWETCGLRSWLNDYFINEAFSANEISVIKNTKVINDDNKEWGVEAGNDTYDKVYLLSISEAEDKAYGFNPEPKVDDIGRGAIPTSYAVEKGVVLSKELGFEGWCKTWLRSPGRSSDEAAYVWASGYIIQGGSWVNNSEHGIRPVMHIDLASTSEWNYAGTVSSDGTVKEVSIKKEDATTDTTDKTITNSSDGKTDKNSTSKPLTKKVLTKKLTLKVSKKKVKVGKKLTIKVKYSPKNVTYKKVKWSVSNKKWASISSKGVFKAKKAVKGKIVTVKCKVLDGSKKIAKIKIRIK